MVNTKTKQNIFKKTLLSLYAIGKFIVVTKIIQFLYENSNQQKDIDIHSMVLIYIVSGIITIGTIILLAWLFDK